MVFNIDDGVVALLRCYAITKKLVAISSTMCEEICVALRGYQIFQLWNGAECLFYCSQARIGNMTNRERATTGWNVSML